MTRLPPATDDDDGAAPPKLPSRPKPEEEEDVATKKPAAVPTKKKAKTKTSKASKQSSSESKTKTSSSESKTKTASSESKTKASSSESKTKTSSSESKKRRKSDSVSSKKRSTEEATKKPAVMSSPALNEQPKSPPSKEQQTIGHGDESEDGTAHAPVIVPSLMVKDTIFSSPAPPTKPRPSVLSSSTTNRDSGDKKSSPLPKQHYQQKQQKQQQNEQLRPPLRHAESGGRSIVSKESVASTTSHHVVAPGAVSVGSVDDFDDLDNDFDEVEEDVDATKTLRDTFHTMSSEPHIEAHLAPDDAEVEARIAERMEDQITKKVEQRLKCDIIVATEVKEDKSPCFCGLTKRTVGILVVCFFVMIGGIVGGVVYSLSGDEEKNLPVQRSPTAAPIIRVDDPLVEELSTWIVPAEQDYIPFSDPTSAQAQALEWLQSDPIALSTNRTSKTVLQRFVLAVLYFATSGDGWLWPYLSADDVCMWNLGDNNTGVFCLGDGETVDRIQMNNNNLRGTLPWELVLLTNLQHVDLDSNRLSGSIPSRIDELAQLEIFWAMSNDLTGPLPQSFGSSMVYLDLNENALTGTIPGNWTTEMPNLRYLVLHVNRLTGTIPSELGLIDPLRGFKFYGNDLTGSVDEYFCGGFIWEALEADCEEVECPCCTKCCYDDSIECIVMNP